MTQIRLIVSQDSPDTVMCILSAWSVRASSGANQKFGGEDWIWTEREVMSVHFLRHIHRPKKSLWTSFRPENSSEL